MSRFKSNILSVSLRMERTARLSPIPITWARTWMGRSISTRRERTSPNSTSSDYDIYTSKMVEERVEVREGDILLIHTGYHRYGWDQPIADEIRYMVKHPGPDREFAEWCKEKKLKWLGVDCGSADHPMNTIIRTWMPRQAKEAQAHFQAKYKKSIEEVFTDDKYQLMHIEMFPEGIIHAECLGGDIDLLLNERVEIGCFPWRFVDGESSIARIVAFVDDDHYAKLMEKKASFDKTKFGDCVCQRPQK
jgi:kynurenine formamidase